MRRRLTTGPFYLCLFVALGLCLVPSGLHAVGSESSWPFSRLKPPSIPEVTHHEWLKNPVDNFILAKLEKEGLQPNPAADKLTLLRRVTFDLTGLAPSAAEREAFLHDAAPDAYEKVVERLLASPRFGERWAQHWLDVVRYAESDGFKLDRFRADAFRYRDYVVRAFNNDVPYDRFLRQQIAGDELEPNNPDALVATGMLRLQPEETNGSNYRQIRQEILDDVTDCFSLTCLGLTMGCARCHDHKFDPISQKDYYRMQAFFAPLLPRDDMALVSNKVRQEYERKLETWKTATAPIRAEIDNLLKPVEKKVFQESVVALDEETQKALRQSPILRSPLQKQLALLGGKQIDRKYSRMYRQLPPDDRARYEELRKKLAEFDNIKPNPIPLAMGAEDVGPIAPPTFRLAGGNYLRPKEEVSPAFPGSIETEVPKISCPSARPNSTGRRSALANWLCEPDHPLTSRVIVNRIWQHLLGVGIVGTPNDFGLMGDQATHPELLDYLASELVSHEWKLKTIHRLIVTSATYCQSSAPELNAHLDKASKSDPDDRLLWHARSRRRDGESIRDTALQVSGLLNLRMYGPSALPELPTPLMESRYSWNPDKQVEDRNRRTIYVYVSRDMPLPLMSAFDGPDRLASCSRRTTTITSPQALFMLNSEFVLDQAQALSSSLLTALGKDRHKLVEEAYERVFGRDATTEEVRIGEEFLTSHSIVVAKGAPPIPDTLPEPMPAGIDPAYAASVVDFCHALLNSAEFLYVD